MEWSWTFSCGALGVGRVWRREEDESRFNGRGASDDQNGGHKLVTPVAASTDSVVKYITIAGGEPGGFGQWVVADKRR
jgi:hypothetical protein